MYRSYAGTAATNSFPGGGAAAGLVGRSMWPPWMVSRTRATVATGTACVGSTGPFSRSRSLSLPLRSGRLPIRRTTMLNSSPVITVCGRSTVKSPAYAGPAPCGMGTNVTPSVVLHSMVCASNAVSGCSPYIHEASLSTSALDTAGQ